MNQSRGSLYFAEAVLHWSRSMRNIKGDPRGAADKEDFGRWNIQRLTMAIIFGAE